MNGAGQAGVGTSENIIGDDNGDSFDPVDLPTGVVPRLIFGGRSSYSYNCFLATNEDCIAGGMSAGPKRGLPQHTLITTTLFHIMEMRQVN